MVRIDQRWFPTNRIDRAAWFANFAKVFSQVGPDLGFAQAEIDSVNADNEMIQFLARNIFQTKVYLEAVRAFEKHITAERVGDTAATFPSIPSFVVPAVPPTGIYQRLNRLVDRIRVAPTYTDETGALLGILRSRREEVNVRDSAPQLKVRAMPGNAVQISFVRGKTDGIELRVRVDKDPEWRDAGRFFRSPAIINIPDNDGLPRAVQVMARYLDGNDAVGQNSNVVSVVTTA